MRVLVTEASSFLGFHVVLRLLQEGWVVDALLAGGDRRVRTLPVEPLTTAGARVHTSGAPADVVAECRPDAVVHLAAVDLLAGADRSRSAGVAGAELQSFTSLLDACCRARVGHLVLGSSAQVYGGNDKLPFGSEQPIDRPLSMSGALPRAEELLAHAVSHAEGLPVTALRFFSLYGPYGPPDEPPLGYARALLAGAPVPLAGGGQLRRDFVFVEDAAEVVMRAVERAPEPLTQGPRFAVHNVGSGTPTPLSRVLELVEAAVGATAVRAEAPVPPTVPEHTWADVRELQQSYGYRPHTPLAKGLAATVEWLRSEAGAAWRRA